MPHSRTGFEGQGHSLSFPLWFASRLFLHATDQYLVDPRATNRH